MSTINNDLAAALHTVQTPGSFFASGVCAMHNPALQVDGVGPLALPLLPPQAQALIAVAERAPYGNGQATVIDTTVRRTWQIAAQRVHIAGRGWAQTLQTVIQLAATGLGAGDDVAAELYKLLVYDEGSFFVNHRDTEKSPRMFGTLIIGLPSLHEGGDLLIQHRGREARLSLRVADPCELAYAAFYADCVHEVLPITSGCRLALVYNLVRTGKGPVPAAPNHEQQTSTLTNRLTRWVNAQITGPTDNDRPRQLVYPLEHAYTPAELSFRTLKGADAAAAAVLTQAAQQAHCELHVALMQIEESGSAEYADGGRSRGWHRYDDDEAGDSENFEIGEIFDRSLQLSHWQDPQGVALDVPRFSFDDEEVCPSHALQGMEPDEQHFHEATGNEGASFERSYQRAAFVLWPRQQRLQVLQRAGPAAQVGYLQGLVTRWKTQKGASHDALWAETQELASHLIAHWPEDHSDPDTGNSPVSLLLVLLLELNDTAHLESFINHLAHTRAYAPGDNAALAAALPLLTAPSAGRLLAALISQHADLYVSACADLLLAAQGIAAHRRQKGHLRDAAKCLLEALPGDPKRKLSPDASSNAWCRQPADAALVCKLLRALCNSEPAWAEQALQHCLAWPKTYGLDAVIVPAAHKLLETPDLRKHAVVQQLAAAARQHLAARVSLPLAPPPDWRRAADVNCHCVHCKGLISFLKSDTDAVWRFKAKEAERSHVAASIQGARCDVDCIIERKGSPHVLVCTKNQASFERRVKQRQEDLRHLQGLGKPGV